MKMQSCFIITILVALAILHTGEARKCYDCVTTSLDKACSSPEPKHETNCTKGNDHCVVCKGKLSDPTFEFIQRSCGTAQVAANVEHMNCDFCNTDLCNSANGLSIGIITLGSFALLWTTRFVL